MPALLTFHVLVIVDDFSRECLALVTAARCPVAGLPLEFDRVVEFRGKPLQIVSDNSTELTSHAAGSQGDLPLHNSVAKWLGKTTPLRNGCRMLFGYARVSKSDDQDPAAQLRELKAAGCRKILQERASGGRWDRPELHRLLDQLREGDTVVVWKLDRLSRSLKDTLTILDRIDAAGASFRSLTEAIDTTGPVGRMMMQMLGAFAEFERAMIRERTRIGLASARADGRTGGRKPKLTPPQRAEILAMLETGRRSAAAIARLFCVHPATVSRLAAHARSGISQAQPLPQ